jgi:hypothetical protein
MPLQNKLPFQLVVVVSCDPLAFQLLDQLDLRQVNSENRVPITDEQISQCKMYYKALIKAREEGEHPVCERSSRRSSRPATKGSFLSVTPTQQRGSERGSESDSGVDRPQRAGKNKSPVQETTQDLHSQEMADKKAKDNAKEQEKNAKAQEKIAKAQEKIARQIKNGRLGLIKSAEDLKKIQVKNKAAKQKLRREKQKGEVAEREVAEQEEAEQEEAEQEEAEQEAEQEEAEQEDVEISDSAEDLSSSKETPSITRSKSAGKTDAQKLTDSLALNQKMADQLAATKKKISEPVREMHIQGLLLEMTAKLDSTALSIQRQIEDKRRDVKAKEKKRERKASEAKTFMMQQQFLDMQTAFQEKISEEFAVQRNRSQLEKGLKKLKLLMETTKTANAEQGKRAFELEVKRLELAQEQARADVLADRADARADARADRADARRHSKRQRSRSARFHFA